MNEITCFGYHISEASILNEDDIPTMVQIPYTTSDFAIQNGWTTTDNKKFSYDGKIVWLCPECSKRWQQEKNTIIDDLIERVNKLYIEYMDTAEDEKERRIDILNRAISTRAKFYQLKPSLEERKRWDNAQMYNLVIK